MDERRVGRIVGAFLADLVFFSVIFGTGIFSIKILSKLIKIVITREAMKSINNNNNHANKDLDYDDLE